MAYATIEKRRIGERLSQRRSRLRFRAVIIGIKLRFGCYKCPEMHPAALQFHHRNPKEKSFTIQNAVARRVNFNLLIKEIEKCDVLCANCHAKEHYDKRVPNGF